ncbi:AMP-binding protein [Bradyrhizobium tropiciagri]|nr:AMP-binding protein [Bradyrhizobium tropiciagri]
MPVNARMSVREVGTIRLFSTCRRAFYCIHDSEAAILHASADDIDRDISILGRVAVSKLDKTTKAEPVFPDKTRQTAVLVFISGTTGGPKGVMVSHQALLYTGANMAELRKVTSDDAFYNASPLSHAIGLGTVLMTAFWAGASVELVTRFTPQHFVEALRDERITAVTAVPTLFSRILEYADRERLSLRSRRPPFVATACAPLNLALKAQVEEAFGVGMGNSHGMTECNPIARSAGRVETNEVGELQPGVVVRLLGEDGNDVSAEEKGELWVRSPSLMLGYYRNEVAAQAALREGGWLATGDIARIGPDGQLFIIGRLRDLIICSGFNVYPAEVGSITSQYPGIAQAAVVGHEVSGNEEVVALVQPKRARLVYKGSGEIGGLVAGVGQRILGGVSKHLIWRFFVALRKEFEAPISGKTE